MTFRGCGGYGPSLPPQWRPAGYEVIHLRNGAKPADVSVERPTSLALVITLQTAQALGLGRIALAEDRLDEGPYAMRSQEFHRSLAACWYP